MPFPQRDPGRSGHSIPADRRNAGDSDTGAMGMNRIEEAFGGRGSGQLSGGFPPSGSGREAPRHLVNQADAGTIRLS